MPAIVALPERGNTITFDPDEVREYAGLLVEAAENGNGVGMDENFPTENKARMRGKRLSELIENRYEVKPRVHVGKAGDEFSTVLSIKENEADDLAGAIETEDAEDDTDDTE